MKDGYYRIRVYESWTVSRFYNRQWIVLHFLWDLISIRDSVNSGMFQSSASLGWLDAEEWKGGGTYGLCISPLKSLCVRKRRLPTIEGLYSGKLNILWDEDWVSSLAYEDPSDLSNTQSTHK